MKCVINKNQDLGSAEGHSKSLVMFGRPLQTSMDIMISCCVWKDACMNCFSQWSDKMPGKKAT